MPINGNKAEANKSGWSWIHGPLEKFSRRVTEWSGSSWAFASAVGIVLLWVVTGPIFQFSDTWQLVINTGTTIVTFLMVFLIQRSQNKDAMAIQVKLDELLAAQPGASNMLIDMEDWDEDEIVAIHKRFSVLAERLKTAADESSPHSISEAQDALEAAHQTLQEVHAARQHKQRHGRHKKNRQNHEPH